MPDREIRQVPKPSVADEAVAQMAAARNLLDAHRPWFGISAGKPGYAVVAFSIFLIALVWGGVTYELDHDRASVIGTAQVNGDNLARAYSEHVLGTMRLLDQMLVRTRGDYENNILTADPVTKMTSISNIAASAVILGIVNEHGDLIATNKSSVRIPGFAAEREFFLAHVNGTSDHVHIGKPIHGRLTNTEVIILSRRLSKPDGTFGGAVFVSFDLNYLSGFFSDLTISKNSSFTIFSPDLVVLDMIRGTGRDLSSIGKSVAGTPIEHELAKTPTGHYETVAVTDGIKRLYSYRALPDYPLIVVAGLAQSDILAGFYWRESRLIGVATVLSIFFVLIATYQLRRITQHFQSEQTLRQTQTLLIQSQRVAKLGYLIHDLRTDRVYWSDSLFELRHVPRRGAFTLDEVAKFIEIEDRDRYFAGQKAAFAKRQTFSADVRVRRPDGTVYWEHRVVHPQFDAWGEIICALCVVQDITEWRTSEERERELQRKLMQSQKLEALGTLAGGIAHDLNNTLTPIMALSKITARRLEPGILRTNIETIHAASQQAGDLVKRVLAFSRQDIIEKKPTNLRNAVIEALTLMRATVPTSIALQTRIDEVPPIMSDPSQIQQIVTNLVSNAAQAIGGRLGTITVTLEMICGAGTDRTIHLSVADTGDGMDDATRERIFEPFFTRKEVGRGTGLGLSIVAGIVADHGGRIEVISTPGTGARFDLHFPISEAETSVAA